MRKRKAGHCSTLTQLFFLIISANKSQLSPRSSFSAETTSKTKISVQSQTEAFTHLHSYILMQNITKLLTGLNTADLNSAKHLSDSKNQIQNAWLYL